MEIKGYVCRVILMAAGNGIFKKLDDILDAIPKDGMYGANPMIPNFDIIYDSMKGAEACAEKLKAKGYRAKAIKIPCFFDSKYLKGDVQKRIADELGKDGVKEFVEDTRKAIKLEKEKNTVQFSLDNAKRINGELQKENEELKARLRISAGKNAEIVAKYEKLLAERDKKINELEHTIQYLENTEE